MLPLLYLLPKASKGGSKVHKAYTQTEGWHLTEETSTQWLTSDLAIVHVYLVFSLLVTSSGNFLEMENLRPQPRSNAPEI